MFGGCEVEGYTAFEEETDGAFTTDAWRVEAELSEYDRQRLDAW